MALMAWNDRYSVGVKRLDEQHAGLFNALNELHSAMMKGNAQQVAGPLLRKLVDYTRDHFRAEEALMESARFAGLTAHRVKHRELTEQVEAFAARFERGDATLSLQLLTFLRTWLTGHIQKEDKEYGPWLNEHGVK